MAEVLEAVRAAVGPERTALLEDALARSRELRAILEHATSAVFLKDLDGRYMLVNRQLELDTGLPREQMLGRSDFELFSRETAERIRADDQRIARTGEPATIEGVTQFPSGARTFLTTKFPLRDDAGNVHAICGLTTDITERKQAEQAIAAREEDLRITLNSIGDAVIAADARGCVTQMNPAAERLTGWALDSASGRPLAEVVQLEQPEHSRYAVLVDRGGGRRQITQTGAPICDAQGEVVGHVTVIRDVTDRARLEDQLQHVQRMNAIGQLAGGVAHDFNNMLAGILAAAELLDVHLPRERTPEIAETITTILATCERAGDLTRKLLAFSRKAPRRTELIDAHELINSTVALLRHSLDRRIAIELRLSAVSPVVRGDPGLLQSALLNLAVNARDAMPDGGTLEIATRNVELAPADCATSPFRLQPGPVLELRVRDTGGGIDDELRLRIFEPFFTTKEVGRGTGLGLAAVHGTVEEHGGSIAVESAIGQGTSFVIRLPSARTLALQRRAPAITLVGEGRILLVDDEDVIRRTGALLLESLGYQVVTARNGREGVELFSNQHGQLDLVLLDMIMPEMNGHDAFWAMQRIDAGVPIVVCSGYAADEAVRSLRDHGLAGFLPKPYRRAELAEILGHARRRAG
ncbi:MAG TPA: PAS domain-containing protein [Enhygromyxa sp.]|nr:PAS domain-containing protein [Enhygromyxa sp.]